MSGHHWGSMMLQLSVRLTADSDIGKAHFVHAGKDATGHLLQSSEIGGSSLSAPVRLVPGASVAAALGRRTSGSGKV